MTKDPMAMVNPDPELQEHNAKEHPSLWSLLLEAVWKGLQKKPLDKPAERG